jgi:hypothetical protein
MMHYGWSVPLADNGYYMVGISIHCFLLFAPFFVFYEHQEMIIQGIILILTGPVLSKYLAVNPNDQIGIWCFLSLPQVINYYPL